MIGALDLRKSAMDDYGGRVEASLDSVDWDWTDLRAIVEPYLTGVAVAAGEDAVSSMGLFDDGTLALMRRDAVDYGRDRAAEMVGMVRHGELLLPNPDPQWSIPKATRDMLRTTVTTALDEGWSAQELRREIKASAGFNAQRAMTIARTELAMADTKGTIAGWRASGLVAGKEWLTAPGCCDFCQTLNGQIVELETDFPAGDPPVHPNCRCTLLSVLEDELPGHHHED